MEIPVGEEGGGMILLLLMGGCNDEDEEDGGRTVLLLLLLLLVVVVAVLMIALVTVFTCTTGTAQGQLFVLVTPLSGMPLYVPPEVCVNNDPFIIDIDLLSDCFPSPCFSPRPRPCPDASPCPCPDASPGPGAGASPSPCRSWPSPCPCAFPLPFLGENMRSTKDTTDALHAREKGGGGGEGATVRRATG